ncbi:MAG: TolC family protein [Eubacteriales bacterium]|nr:TolC family protein [Eubacteriales bacterium]
MFKFKIKSFIVAAAAASAMCLIVPAVTGTGAGTGAGLQLGITAYAATVIEYGNLQQLVTEGNATIKYSSYYDNIDNLEYQLKVLKEECASMMGNVKVADDSGEKSQYRSIAKSLSDTINQLEKRLEKQTGTNASINDTIDMLTMSAQSTLISYLQAETNAQAQEKKAEAAEVKYNNAVVRESAGAAIDTTVTAAHSDMLAAQSQAISYRQQADSFRRSLFQMLGLTDDGSITIAEIPAPDLAAIAAVDFNADLEQAVNNDPTVQQIRHNRSDSTSAMQLKAASEEEAVGNSKQDFEETYVNLQNKLEEYNAAVSAYSAAEQLYQGAQRKQANGMMTNADFLSAESDYISARAAYQTASMGLVSAYDTYKWMLKGVA